MSQKESEYYILLPRVYLPLILHFSHPLCAANKLIVSIRCMVVLYCWETVEIEMNSLIPID